MTRLSPSVDVIVLYVSMYLLFIVGELRCQRRPRAGNRKRVNLLASSLARGLYRVGHPVSWPGKPG